MSPNSSRKSVPSKSKPSKPTPDFPLFPHATKRWAKKIRGQLVYFGPWDDPDAALAKYLTEKDALFAGRRPDTHPDTLTVYTLTAQFLTTKKTMRDAGELSIHSFDDYTKTCKTLNKSLGKNRAVADLRPHDFEKLRSLLAKTLGPHRLGNEINRTRIVFNYAFKNRLIDRPMVYGEGFRRPTKKTLRLHRAASGPKMFTADEIRRMIEAAGQPLKTMILLGLNCGFGNSDVGTLPLSAINLASGWIEFPRPKTGIGRRCPLWPETVAALQDWLKARPDAKNDEDAGLVFLTKYGEPWAKETTDNPVSKETRKLLDALKITGHRNFYALRHTFQTIGDNSRDFVAVRTIMGHVGSDIADDYRELIEDERLRAVTEHVRQWLFAEAAVKVG